MPRRKAPLVSGEIYHIFNKGITGQITFLNSKDYKRAKLTLKYYLYSPLPIRFSRFLELSSKRKKELFQIFKPRKIVSVIAYVFMPNHFHLLVKQEEDKGIQRFVGNFQNSYTRYFNTKNKRAGSLFLNRFKAVRIKTEEQLYHVSRYIHLNPYSSEVVKTLKELEQYKWSSLPEYLGLTEEKICDKELILGHFGNIERYKSFVFNQADYQRSLERIKRVVLE